MPTYIYGATRSPIGKFGGGLSRIPAPEIAGQLIKKIVKDNKKIISSIDEIIIGNVLSAGLGQNPARIAAFTGGLSIASPGYTVNKVCGSGLKSIALASMMINGLQADLIMAGGMENMSRAPYLLDDYRLSRLKLGHRSIKDSLIVDGLHCALINQHMGLTAEFLAKKFKISRKEQDEYALKSHQKAISSIDKLYFKQEICSIEINDKKQKVIIDTDEQPRRNTSLEALAQLKPVFLKNGSVTPGNASSLNDAAAMILLGSEKITNKYHIRPMALVRGYQSIAINPKLMGLGAYYAINKLLKNLGLAKEKVDLWEINEAFASQIIAVLKLLKIDHNLVNVNGGAIALGHPIGASGTRILVTLIHELKRKKLKFGVAALCIGGGQGIAMLIENI